MNEFTDSDNKLIRINIKIWKEKRSETKSKLLIVKYTYYILSLKMDLFFN
jgi:hypothetical protein